MKLPTSKQVGEIIDILYPHWRHFGNKESLILHHGEYDENEERHRSSIYTIIFINPTNDKADIRLSFFKSGIQIFETEKNKTVIETSTHQFNLHNYLIKNNLII